MDHDGCSSWMRISLIHQSLKFGGKCFVIGVGPTDQGVSLLFPSFISRLFFRLLFIQRYSRLILHPDAHHYLPSPYHTTTSLSKEAKADDPVPIRILFRKPNLARLPIQILEPIPKSYPSSFRWIDRFETFGNSSIPFESSYWSFWSRFGSFKRSYQGSDYRLGHFDRGFRTFDLIGGSSGSS
jgi:hypothetical protein